MAGEAAAGEAAESAVVLGFVWNSDLLGCSSLLGPEVCLSSYSE